MSWSLRKLDELGTVSRGRSRHRPRDAEHLYGGPYPFIQTGDVKHGELHLNEYSQTYSEAGLAQSKLWPSGTLCITIAANIADTAILSFDACFPDSIIGFIADPDKADTRFIKYLFDATLQRHFQRFTQGAAQDNLSEKKLLSLDFLVPENVALQKHVADVLCAYDELIENNSRRIKLLDQAARLLYKEWFVHLRFPGHEHVKVVNGVPNGWCKGSASDAMDVMSGGTPKTTVPSFWDGVIPFYTPKDSVPESYVLETEKHLTDFGLSNCNSGLYPKDAIFITARGTVGNLNLAQRPMAMNQSCYALAGKDGIPPKFLYCALREAIQHFRQQAAGAVFDAIIGDTFKLIPFIVPDSKLVLLFEEMVDPLFKQVENLLLQNQKLRNARDLLLPRLMNGTVTV